ncbi:hypothetical protein BaRGS_00005878, partial [Batillaria attramentaria]
QSRVDVDCKVGSFANVSHVRVKVNDRRNFAEEEEQTTQREKEPEQKPQPKSDPPPPAKQHEEDTACTSHSLSIGADDTGRYRSFQARVGREEVFGSLNDRLVSCVKPKTKDTKILRRNLAALIRPVGKHDLNSPSVNGGQTRTTQARARQTKRREGEGTATYNKDDGGGTYSRRDSQASEFSVYQIREPRDGEGDRPQAPTPQWAKSSRPPSTAVTPQSELHSETEDETEAGDTYASEQALREAVGYRRPKSGGTVRERDKKASQAPFSDAMQRELTLVVEADRESMTSRAAKVTTDAQKPDSVTPPASGRHKSATSEQTVRAATDKPSPDVPQETEATGSPFDVATERPSLDEQSSDPANQSTRRASEQVPPVETAASRKFSQDVIKNGTPASRQNGSQSSSPGKANDTNSSVTESQEIQREENSGSDTRDVVKQGDTSPNKTENEAIEVSNDTGQTETQTNCDKENMAEETVDKAKQEMKTDAPESDQKGSSEAQATPKHEADEGRVSTDHAGRDSELRRYAEQESESEVKTKLRAEDFVVFAVSVQEEGETTPSADPSRQERAADTMGEDHTSSLPQNERTAVTQGEDHTSSTSQKESTADTPGEDYISSAPQKESMADTSGEDHTSSTPKKESTAGTPGEDHASGTQQKESTTGTTGEDHTPRTPQKESTANTSGAEYTSSTPEKAHTADIPGEEHTPSAPQQVDIAEKKQREEHTSSTSQQERPGGTLQQEHDNNSDGIRIIRHGPGPVQPSHGTHPTARQETERTLMSFPGQQSENQTPAAVDAGRQKQDVDVNEAQTKDTQTKRPDTTSRPKMERKSSTTSMRSQVGSKSRAESRQQTDTKTAVTAEKKGERKQQRRRSDDMATPSIETSETRRGSRASVSDTDKKPSSRKTPNGQTTTQTPTSRADVPATPSVPTQPRDHAKGEALETTAHGGSTEAQEKQADASVKTEKSNRRERAKGEGTADVTVNPQQEKSSVKVDRADNSGPERRNPESRAEQAPDSPETRRKTNLAEEGETVNASTPDGQNIAQNGTSAVLGERTQSKQSSAEGTDESRQPQQAPEGDRSPKKTPDSDDVKTANSYDAKTADQDDVNSTVRTNKSHAHVSDSEVTRPDTRESMMQTDDVTEMSAKGSRDDAKIPHQTTEDRESTAGIIDNRSASTAEKRGHRQQEEQAEVARARSKSRTSHDEGIEAVDGDARAETKTYSSRADNEREITDGLVGDDAEADTPHRGEGRETTDTLRRSETGTSTAEGTREITGTPSRANTRARTRADDTGEAAETPALAKNEARTSQPNDAGEAAGTPSGAGATVRASRADETRETTASPTGAQTRAESTECEHGETTDIPARGDTRASRADDTRQTSRAGTRARTTDSNNRTAEEGRDTRARTSHSVGAEDDAETRTRNSTYGDAGEHDSRNTQARAKSERPASETEIGFTVETSPTRQDRESRTRTVSDTQASPTSPGQNDWPGNWTQEETGGDQTPTSATSPEIDDRPYFRTHDERGGDDEELTPRATAQSQYSHRPVLSPLREADTPTERDGDLDGRSQRDSRSGRGTRSPKMLFREPSNIKVSEEGETMEIKDSEETENEGGRGIELLALDDEDFFDPDRGQTLQHPHRRTHNADRSQPQAWSEVSEDDELGNLVFLGEIPPDVLDDDSLLRPNDDTPSKSFESSPYKSFESTPHKSATSSPQKSTENTPRKPSRAGSRQADRAGDGGQKGPQAGPRKSRRGPRRRDPSTYADTAPGSRRRSTSSNSTVTFDTRVTRMGFVRSRTTLSPTEPHHRHRPLHRSRPISRSATDIRPSMREDSTLTSTTFRQRPRTTANARSRCSEFSDGRSKQREFFKEELRRLEGGLKRESSKIVPPSRRKYTPFIFNTLEPYYNTHTTRFLIELPEEQFHAYSSRSTAIGLCDPWVDLRMDQELLPSISSRPTTRHDTTGRRKELKDKYSSQAKQKIDADYKRTQQDFYRMDLDRMDKVAPTSRRHLTSTYMAYLQNTPGSRRAVSECVQRLEGKAN